MGFLENDENNDATIKVRATTILCIVYIKDGHGIDRYLFRIMECVTFIIDLTYEIIHIAWARYETNLVIFNIN